MDQKGISELVAKISQEEKSQFKSDLRNRIERRISSKKPAQCLEVITTSPTGRIAKWGHSDGVAFFKRFWCFLRKKPYKERGASYQLDSALTSEVLEDVNSSFENVIKNNQDALVDLVIAEIITTDSLRNILINELCIDNTLSKIARKNAQSAINQALLQGVQDQFQGKGGEVAAQIAEKAGAILAQSVSTGVASKVAVVAAKAISTGVGKTIVTKLSIVIGKSLGPILAKLLAKPALATALKKFVIVGIIGSIGKLIVAKFGAGALSAAVWIIVIPLIIVWVKKDITNFPTKLSQKLGEAVTGEIDNGFESYLRKIFTQLIAGFTTDLAVKGIANAILDDRQVANQISTVMTGMSEDIPVTRTSGAEQKKQEPIGGSRNFQEIDVDEGLPENSSLPTATDKFLISSAEIDEDKLVELVVHPELDSHSAQSSPLAEETHDSDFLLVKDEGYPSSVTLGFFGFLRFIGLFVCRSLLFAFTFLVALIYLGISIGDSMLLEHEPNIVSSLNIFAVWVPALIVSATLWVGIYIRSSKRFFPFLYSFSFMFFLTVYSFIVLTAGAVSHPDPAVSSSWTPVLEGLKWYLGLAFVGGMISFFRAQSVKRYRAGDFGGHKSNAALNFLQQI